jgi:hypothetical protein
MFHRGIISLALILLLVSLLTGCRRNLMRINTTPPGAVVFVEGEVVREEDANGRMARRVDRKKEKGRTLSEEEFEFEQTRKRIQRSPVEYEFDSLNAGYLIYSRMDGFQPTQKTEFLAPKWYEYPVIDLVVDLLPFTITDTREVHLELPPAPRPESP